MKEIILDTDIGVDCDDAIALLLLINSIKKNQCKCDTIVTSTTRIGAVASIKAISNYYGYKFDNIGKLNFPVLPCDATNIYAKDLMDKYNCDDLAEDSTIVLRKKFVNLHSKITYVAIGPLISLKNFLSSKADNLSPLTGQELFDMYVDELFIMSGAFNGIDNSCYSSNNYFAEWNVLQDIESVRFVINAVKCKIVAIPFETGCFVLTGAMFTDTVNNPITDSMKKFKKNTLKSNSCEKIVRESWDPITCFVAINGTQPPLRLSQEGKIIVDTKGITTFDKCCKNNHYVVLLEKNKESIMAKKINDLLIN